MRRVRFSVFELRLSSEMFTVNSLPKDGKLASRDAETPNRRISIGDQKISEKLFENYTATILPAAATAGWKPALRIFKSASDFC